jgi:pSer/pThr/pTyr-binding forkhead associated (FHA) protein
MLLGKAETTIGRAEACDVGLFGDPGVERLHARIVRRGDDYFLADAGTAGGTFLNDRRVTDPAPLRSGDAIRVGGCVLRFGLRRSAAG